MGCECTRAVDRLPLSVISELTASYDMSILATSNARSTISQDSAGSEGDSMMLRGTRPAVVALVSLILQVAAYAQASISDIVKDMSGAMLPSLVSGEEMTAQRADLSRARGRFCVRAVH